MKKVMSSIWGVYVKWAMVESTREVCGSVSVGEKNRKGVVE